MQISFIAVDEHRKIYKYLFVRFLTNIVWIKTQVAKVGYFYKCFLDNLCHMQLKLLS